MESEFINHLFEILKKEFPDANFDDLPFAKKEWLAKLNKINSASPVKYYPSVDIDVPDIFFHEETLERLSHAFSLYLKNNKETTMKEDIVNNEYVLSPISVGEEGHVITERKTYPTDENPFNPYQATIFDFHTHPFNLIPSQADMRGHLFSAGSIQTAISHKKSSVNPLFLIGRNNEGQQEILSYCFDKEKLPTPKNLCQRNDFVASFYSKIHKKIGNIQNLYDDNAKKQPLEFYVDAMNSISGINSYGKILKTN